MSLSVSILQNALWDLFLGLVPVALAWLLSPALRWTPPRFAWVWAPLVLAWLAFLPNSCYLLTELRHFREIVALNPHLLQKNLDVRSLEGFLLVGAFYLVFSGSGLILFTLAVRPLERLGRQRGWPVNLLAPLLFLLVSFGVYLGLRLRLNSWDLVRQPAVVLGVTLEALPAPSVWRFVAAFALFLWLGYLLVDIWLDGLVLRRERWLRWLRNPPA